MAGDLQRDFNILAGTLDLPLRESLLGQGQDPLRVSFLAAIIDALKGSYNREGINRWFLRPRTELQGQSPQDVLRGDWKPDDPTSQTVAELAARLAGP